MQFAGATQPPGRIPRYLAPAALAALLAAIIVVVVGAAGSSGTHLRSTSLPHPAVHGVPPYWTVRPGETYAQISQKTGLTIGQLEPFNPQTDPNNLLPGQRLNLWPHPPAPRPKPPGPRFRTVRTGESFGSIAAKTGINLTELEQVNPKLKPPPCNPETG